MQAESQGPVGCSRHTMCSASVWEADASHARLANRNRARAVGRILRPKDEELYESRRRFQQVWFLVKYEAQRSNVGYLHRHDSSARSFGYDFMSEISVAVFECG